MVEKLAMPHLSSDEFKHKLALIDHEKHLHNTYKMEEPDSLGILHPYNALILSVEIIKKTQRTYFPLFKILLKRLYKQYFIL